MNKKVIRSFVTVILMTMIVVETAARNKDEIRDVDICVYGGTSAGVIAAYTAQQSGKSVLLIEPGKHLGGLSSGGLGSTDIGNKYVVQGLALDFYRRIGQHYGKSEQWIFEPKVAEEVFNEYIRKGNIEVWYDSRLASVTKEDNVINTIEIENSLNPVKEINKIIRAKVFIDCSYEGDLMAKSGVSYTFGREPNSLYNETYNGVQLMTGHQLPNDIDPYVIKGDKSSGLIYGIRDANIDPNGTGDKKIQAYNFRITLTNIAENRDSITMPDNYDPKRYELLLRLKEKNTWKKFTDIFLWSMMPNGKTDINNYGGFSTDVVGENWNYPEATYEERKKIWKFHEDYTKGLLYFVGHDSRVPEFVREGMLQWGYPKDEYLDNNHWSHQLYIRECRRMIGQTVMTQVHCQGKEVVPDGVGWAAYTMDSHNCDRLVLNGMAKNEGNVEIGGFGPYPISYGAITPKLKEASNLLVPVCLSASHIAYGSIRMEPVFMVLAQTSAIAACLAIDYQKNVVQNVKTADIMKEFWNNPLADGRQPEVLADNLIKGGDMETASETFWTTSFLNTVSSADHPYYEFGHTAVIPSAGAGGCLKVSVNQITTGVSTFAAYQKVTLTAGVNYTFDAAFRWTDITDISLLFIIGSNAPVDGMDYSKDSPHTLLADIGRWDKPATKTDDPTYVSSVWNPIIYPPDSKLGIFSNGPKVFTPATSGDYYLVIKATAPAGKIFNFFIDDVTLTSTITGVSEINNNNDIISSNDGQIEVKSDSVLDQVKIYDINGKLIKSITPNTNWYVSGKLKAGFYIINIDGKVHKIFVK